MEERIAVETKIGPEAGACERRGRFWAVTDAAGRLVCLAVYKKGAQEVLRRLGFAGDDIHETDRAKTRRQGGRRG